MEGLRQESQTARALAQALGDERFMLVDVGCSGGLDPGWRMFDDRLTAYGFDPSVHEIARLTAAETRRDVHYINAFVGLPADSPLDGGRDHEWMTDPWRRVSAYRTQIIQQARAAGLPTPPPLPPPVYQPLPPAPPRAPRPPAVIAAPQATVDQSAMDQDDLMKRNLWHTASLSTRTISLPDFLEDQGVASLDFIKIDVDGADFDILRSVEQPLTDLGVLGVCIEVGYSGTGEPDYHSFHNVDLFMRRQGFDLLDLTVRRYSLACLPSPFQFPHPFAAQTSRGRPLIGDALYLRDFGHGCRLDPADWSDGKLIKLAALHCLFGLLDHAVELLILFRSRLQSRLDVDALLEMMTAELQELDADLIQDFPRFASYAEYIAAYEADAPAFYGAQAREFERRMQAFTERDRARSDVQRLIADRLIEQGEMQRLRQALAEAEADRSAMTHSLSWRLTRPVRALRRLLFRAP